MDRSTIVNKIKHSADKYGSSNPQQLEQLSLICSKAPEREIFFGLFSFFCDENLQNNQFQRQELAGKILLKITPASSLELDASVYASAQKWNRSIEELPWYWCNVFGTKEVINFLTNLIPSVEDKEIEENINTMLFWCRNYKQ